MFDPASTSHTLSLRVYADILREVRRVDIPCATSFRNFPVASNLKSREWP